MAASSVCKFVHCIALILTRMPPNYIMFPEAAGTHQVTEDFHDAIAGLPGVIGCTDGTLIRIVSPGGNIAELYR